MQTAISIETYALDSQWIIEQIIVVLSGTYFGDSRYRIFQFDDVCFWHNCYSALETILQELLTFSFVHDALDKPCLEYVQRTLLCLFLL